MYTPVESQRKSAAASSEKTSSQKNVGLHLEDNRPDLLQRQEISASGNHQHTIQRFVMPAFAGQHPVNVLNRLPASVVNYNPVVSGPFTIPTQSNAALGAYLAGSGATNTKLSIAINEINQARGSFYERCHLVAHKLGGGGTAANTVPASKTMNQHILNNVEMPIINARGEEHKRLFNYSVTAHYGDHGNANLTSVEKRLPLNFQFTLQELFWNGQDPSTDRGNWGQAADINMGADAIATNDLSGLPALDDAPKFQDELGSIKGLSLYFEGELEKALAAEGLTEAIDVNRAKAFVRQKVMAGIISGDVVRALPREVIGRLSEYVGQTIPEIVAGAIERARQREAAKAVEPQAENPAPDISGKSDAVEPPAARLAPDLSGKSTEDLFALLDQMVQKYAEDVDKLLEDALALRDRVS